MLSVTDVEGKARAQRSQETDCPRPLTSKCDSRHPGFSTGRWPVPQSISPRSASPWGQGSLAPEPTGMAGQLATPRGAPSATGGPGPRRAPHSHALRVRPTGARVHAAGLATAGRPQTLRPALRGPQTPNESQFPPTKASWVFHGGVPLRRPASPQASPHDTRRGGKSEAAGAGGAQGPGRDGG